MTAIRSTARWAARLSWAILFVPMAFPAARAQTVAAPQPPADTPTLVTIAQFENFLSAHQHAKDAKFAAQLAGFELTERAGSTRLARWLQLFPGPRTAEALTALVDLSAFEEPPAADLPAVPAPDPEMQRQIFARAVEYVANIRPTLPNFSALRSTARFEIATRDQINAEKRANKAISLGSLKAIFEPLGRRTLPGFGGSEWLFFAASSADTVTYRDGQEVSEAALQLLTRNHLPELSTRGEFGPILIVVLRGIANGKLEWSHWGPGEDKPVAVFRFSVPANASKYAVYATSSTPAAFPAYHGEISVDPITGAILRIVLFARTGASHLSQSDIEVNYGPVEIAGKTYICPVRSIALSRDSPPTGKNDAHQPQTFLNDVSFTMYHVFRSDVRIVP